MVPSPAEAGKKKIIKNAALLALVLKNQFHKQLGFFPLPLPIPVAIEQKLPPKVSSNANQEQQQPVHLASCGASSNDCYEFELFSLLENLNG